MYAEEARRKFWDTLRDVVKEEGNPFYFTENKQWAIINKPTANYHDPCVAVDFLWRDEILRINVYIEDNVFLYEDLRERKEEIESRLTFRCMWKENSFLTNGGKAKFNGTNTRRIEVDIPFDNHFLDFRALAKKAVPIVKRFVEVFREDIIC